MLKFSHAPALYRGLTRPAPATPTGYIDPARLMAESERRLTEAICSRTSDEVLVARRILDDTSLYRRWESEHSAMLLHCFDEYQGLNQTALLAASLALIHRKGFFQFLRDQALSGRQRALLVRRIYGHSDHERLIVMEHATWLRSSASLICAGHVGSIVLKNPVFGPPLLEYEELYSDYFSALCSATMAHKRDPFLAYHRGLASSMKRRIDLRRSILLRCSASESALH